MLRLLGLPTGPDTTREQVAGAIADRSAQAFEAEASAHGLVVAAMRSAAAWQAHPQHLADVAGSLITIERIGDAPPLPWPALASDAQPLTGLRVLDLTRILAGPAGTRTLAAYGADVLLVNSPHLPNIEHIADTSRGKRSALADLRSAQDRAAIDAVLRDAHVMVQGYRPGGLAALGLGADVATRIRPGLVYVSLSAYAEGGPWQGRRGFDSLVQTATGLNADEAAAAGVDEPKALPTQILDMATAFLIAFATEAALLRQQREGGSWHVRLALSRKALWLRSLGRVDDRFTAPTLDLPSRSESSSSGFGELVAIRHAARLAKTPARYDAPSMPPGSAPLGLAMTSAHDASSRRRMQELPSILAAPTVNLVFPHTFVPWFRTVAPHIHAYHGKTFVVAIAGELIAAGKLASFAQDLAILQAMGIKIVLAHGFRPQVDEQLRSKGHAARHHNGLRITDEVALDSAQEAAGQLRFEIEAAFSQGLPNTPMANAIVRVVSGNFLTAQPVGVVDGVDFMHSGIVRKVDAVAIRRAIDIGAMLLLSPFGFSPTGEAFNLTMEDVATSTAIALQADKLLFVTEVNGIHEDPTDPQSPIDTELALADAEKILAALPPPQKPTDTAFYLRHCVRACRGGVERSHILPFAIDGSLLMEVFTHDGIGTMVVDEKLESLRQATCRRHRRRAPPDRAVRARRHARQARPDGNRARYRRLHRHRARRRDFRLRRPVSLSGEPNWRKWRRIHRFAAGARPGRRRANTQAGRAAGQVAMGLESIFVLTTRTMHWFIKRGFVQVDRRLAARGKRKRKYNWDRRSQVFVKKLAA